MSCSSLALTLKKLILFLSAQPWSGIKSSCCISAESPVQSAAFYVLVKTFQVNLSIFKKVSVVLEVIVLCDRYIAK